MSPLDADVVVVGVGPAGSMTAAILARRGYSVLALDRSEFPREKACGEYFSPGVVDILTRQGAGTAVLSADHCDHPGMVIRTARTDFMLRYEQNPVPRRSIGIQRPVFDQILLDHALRQGVKVRHRSRVTGVICERGRVAGVTTREAHQVEHVRAKMIVGADGLHSTVSRSLGLDRPIRWPKRLGLIARYAVPVDAEVRAEMHVGHQVYCGLNPVAPGLVNVGIVGRLDAKHPGESTGDYFQRRLDELPRASARLTQGRRATRIRGMGPLARKVRRVSGPGFLLVGDAAGFFDPFTGEGVFRALRGAELAAEAIDESLRGNRHDPAAYPSERSRAFDDKERLCALIQLFLGHGRVFDYALARMQSRPAIARTFSGALGDYLPASSTVQPSQLWALLKP